MTLGHRPIGTLVADASHRAAHAVAGQALCLALGTFGVALALALLGGAELIEIGAHVAAATAALAVGAAWRATHPIDARQLVRRADGALELGGAFEAALEEEARSPGGTFAALTAQRLLRVARPRELRAAAEPNAVPFAALPLAAAVLLAAAAALALERRPQRSAVHQLAYGAADDLSAAMEQAVRQGSISTDTLRELAAATAEARLLGLSLAGTGVTGSAAPGSGGAPSPATGAQEAGEGPPRGAAGDEGETSQHGTHPGGRAKASHESTAAELARRVDALAAELTTASEGVRSALDRAALALDTLSLGDALTGAPDPGSRRETGESVTAARARDMMEGSRAPDATGDRAAHGLPDAGASVAQPSPPGEGDSFPEASNAVRDSGAPAQGPAAHAPGAIAAPAVAAGRPWPSRYDALAERWSRDHTRAAATTNPPPTDEQ